MPPLLGGSRPGVPDVPPEVIPVANRLLTPEEVAGRLQISRLTVMSYLRGGVLKGIKVGRLWRVDEADLQDFLNAGWVEAEVGGPLPAWDWGPCGKPSGQPVRFVGPGDVLIAALPSHAPGGREQQGTRPVVVVGVPPEPLRYPVVMVAPVTSQDGSWIDANPSIYVRLGAGAGGLPVKSTVLLDQTRAIDGRRALEYLGTLRPGDCARIQSGLRQVFAL